jgi:hypothetical protein
MENTEQLRDQAALVALGGLLAEGRDCPYTEIAVDAYMLADAFLAARELPGRYEQYAENYRREAAQREKERIEYEVRSKAFEPLYQWHKEHCGNGCLSILLEFTTKHKPKDGEDVVEAFKAWVQATNPHYLSKIK